MVVDCFLGAMCSSASRVGGWGPGCTLQAVPLENVFVMDRTKH